MLVVALACALSMACASGATAHRASKAAGCAGAHARPSAANARVVDAATLCLLNRARAAAGLRALRANPALGRAASAKVAGMLRGDYFADVGPSGRTPMSLVASTRYARAAAVGQNIAWGIGASATPASVVAAWMASAAHREVILDGQYRDAGVAVVAAVPALMHVRGHGATYTVELGARRG